MAETRSRTLHGSPTSSRARSGATRHLAVFLLALTACSDPPAPQTSVEPPAPERPAIPTPAATGAFFVSSEPSLAAPSVSTPGPARVVPQRRPGPPVAIAFVDDDTIAVLDDDGIITLLDLADGAVRAVFRGLGAPPLEVHGSLLTARSMRVDLRAGQAVMPTLAAPSAWVGWTHASPRGDRFVAQGGAMVVGGTREGELIAEVVQNAGSEPTVHWLPDGERFALCHRAVEIHSARDGALVARWETDETLDDQPACSVRPQGGAIAWIGAHTVTLLHPDTLAVLRELAPEGEAGPDRVEWSSDGSYLLTWRRGGGRVAVYDAVSGELVRALDTRAPAVSAIVGAGGRWLAVGAPSRVVLVELATGELREVTLETNDLRPGPARVAFDATGTRLAVACELTLGVIDLLAGPDAPLTALDTRSRPHSAPAHAQTAGETPALYVEAGPVFRWSPEGTTRLAVEWTDLASVGADGRPRVDPERYARLESRGGCHVATRRADAALVVLASDGTERATLALDEGEQSPCASAWNCRLPIAIDESCARLAIQRGEELRVFDASSGRVLGRRSLGDRVDASAFAIAGEMVRTVREDDRELTLWQAPTLRPLFRERLVEGDEEAAYAFGPQAAWHAYAVSGSLVITSLARRGRPVRTALEDETRSLYAAGDALVRETDHRLELRDPRTGALLTSLESHGPRLVLEATVTPPTVSFVDCSGGRLRAVANGAEPRFLGACLAVDSFFRVGELVAFVDDHQLRLLRPSDGALAALEPFIHAHDGWLALANADGTSVADLAEHAEHWRLRAAGPVMDAALGPVTFDPDLRQRFVSGP